MSQPALPDRQSLPNPGRPDDLRLLRAACGMPRPLSLSIQSRHQNLDPDQDDSKPRTLRLETPFARIGRDPRAEIVLDDPAVSRLHALLVVIAGRPFVVDLGSRTGLIWPAGPAREGWLEEEMAVGIGPFQLSVVGERESDSGSLGWPEPAAWPEGCIAPLSSRPVVHDLLPPLTVEFPSQRAGKSTHWEMRSLITLVGSSPACKICIEHPALSRYECALVRTPLGPWALSLLGRCGISQQGEQVSVLPLKEGDSFTIGDRRIVSRLTTRSPKNRASASSRELARRESSSDRRGLQPTVVDPLSTELVEQFGQMQSELLDQVRQSLLTMGRWLGNVHREEMVRMREELNELRQAVAARDESGRPSPMLNETPTTTPRLTPPSPDTGHNGLPPQSSKSPTPQPPHPTLPVDDIAGDDLHRLLIGKVEQLQREQRTRWNRLLQRAKEPDA